MPGCNGLRVFGDFWKKQLVEIWSWTKRVEIRTLASPVWSTGCAARGGVRWNSQHSKNCVSLSPRVENLKVKKVLKFRTWTKESRQCFAGFLCMWIFHIFVFRICCINPFRFTAKTSVLMRVLMCLHLWMIVICSYSYFSCVIIWYFSTILLHLKYFHFLLKHPRSFCDLNPTYLVIF